MTLRVGFIGLGAMGASMARHLHRQGLLVAVANRSHGKAEALASELGVSAFADVAELAAQCDIVALCVGADADVLGLVDALLPGLAAHAVVIDHTTVAPATAREAAQRLATRGARFLDAPVSGGVEGARLGTLAVMVGGDAETLAYAQPALDCYGKRIVPMGGVGAGQSTKAVNQVLVAGIAEAVCEGLALGEALGLKADALLPVLGSGAAGNWFLDKRGASMLRDDFTPGFKLGLLHKDLAIVRGIASAAGTDTHIIDLALADYATLIARGDFDADTSALIELKRPTAKA
ncbi:MAG: NAD(P)-dependent oxidoreductase [Xanthomonadales bacterium]|nr:NAD(P)-dependent oxidoreductase [Xanthomonadales bacterium]